MQRSQGNCRTLSLFHLLGTRWTIPIIELFTSARHSELHFNMIQSHVTGITPRSLSRSLEELEDAGIIARDSNKSCYYLTSDGIVLQRFIQSGKTLGMCIYGTDSSCANRMCITCPAFWGN